MFKIHQRSILYTNKQPRAAYRREHDRQRNGKAEKIALMNLGQRHAQSVILLIVPCFEPHDGELLLTSTRALPSGRLIAAPSGGLRIVVLRPTQPGLFGGFWCRERSPGAAIDFPAKRRRHD